MISAIGWMRKEATAPCPTKFKLSPEEYEAFISHASAQIDSAKKEALDGGIDLDVEMAQEEEDEESGEVVEVSQSRNDCARAFI